MLCTEMRDSNQLVLPGYALTRTVHNMLDERDRQFLIGFKEGHPDWSYFSVPHIQHLPAVRWKMHNLERVDSSERQRMVNKLTEYFGLAGNQ